ncbi:MAG TPA: ROK family protein [Bryobacteraceae bacterium]|nr:ROK family protein [Bryobacteraceae bacterium]
MGKTARQNILLVIDVGGTNVKVRTVAQTEPIKIPSGPTMPPTRMVQEVHQVLNGLEYTGVAIGYPGPVVNGQPAMEPHNLAPGWVGFDYAAAFTAPVKIINDAAMQALGSYEGGRMLFLGLGTGLGSALIIDNVLAPLELAHLPYRKDLTFEDYVGLRGLERCGKKKWRESVLDVVARLKAALVVDYVVLGGGNAKHMRELPRDVRLGDNANAFRGGLRMFGQDYPREGTKIPAPAPPSALSKGAS